MPAVSVPEGLFTALGFASGYLLNFYSRKPFNTGIHKHMILAVAGFYFGRGLDKWNNEAQQKKLVILEDYVRLHPEDFVSGPTKTFKDVMYPWVPVR